MRSIPMINTLRLMLCGMRPEDFERFAEIWADPDVVRHITHQPQSRAESWDRFLRNSGHWQMTGFGQWAVIDQQTRRMIGQTGFFNRMRGLGEDFDSCPEAGWVLATDAQGKGFGREAVQAAHDWWDRIMPGPLVATMTEDNSASRHLAESLGYELMRKAEYRDGKILLLKRSGPPA